MCNRQVVLPRNLHYRRVHGRTVRHQSIPPPAAAARTPRTTPSCDLTPPTDGDTSRSSADPECRSRSAIPQNACTNGDPAIGTATDGRSADRSRPATEPTRNITIRSQDGRPRTIAPPLPERPKIFRSSGRTLPSPPPRATSEGMPPIRPDQNLNTPHKIHSVNEYIDMPYKH